MHDTYCQYHVRLDYIRLYTQLCDFERSPVGVLRYVSVIRPHSYPECWLKYSHPGRELLDLGQQSAHTDRVDAPHGSLQTYIPIILIPYFF